MKLWIGILIGGIAAVTSPYAARWFVKAWVWLQTAAPGLIHAVRGLFG